MNPANPLMTVAGQITDERLEKVLARVKRERDQYEPSTISWDRFNEYALALTELQHRREAEAGARVGSIVDDQYVGPFTKCSCGGTKLELRGKFWCCTKCGASYGEHAGLAASPSPPAASGVRVKALEWVQLTSHREDGPPEPIAEWEATCLAGIYSISDEGGEWFLSLATIMDVIPHLGRSSDPDALRAVAQSDFAGRILSALGEHP